MTWRLTSGEDGVLRCGWPGVHADYLAYHDTEWGVPVSGDDRLFEKLCLEGFQSGLSWLTILRKRENFRAAFHAFEIDRVARFGDKDVERLLGDAGIVRHRGKIEAAIGNAKQARQVQRDFGSFAAFMWSFEPRGRRPALTAETLPSVTAESVAMAKALKKRGFRFCGPTTMYALMQAMGMVNDHLPGCVFRQRVEDARGMFARPE